MEKPSTISRLPQDIRDKITGLRNQGRTIDEILAHLGQLDVDVSRAALGRYVKKMGVVTERINQSRQLAEAVARSFGGKEASMVSKTNIEILHSILMKSMIGKDDDAEDVVFDPKEAMFLATALEKLAKASKSDIDTQLVVAREEERQSATVKAAETAVKESIRQGLSSEGVEAVKKSILGIRDGQSI